MKNRSNWFTIWESNCLVVKVFKEDGISDFVCNCTSNQCYVKHWECLTFYWLGSSNSTSQFFCVTLKFDINFADLLSKRRKQKCQRNQPTNSSQLNYISFDFWKFKQLQTSFLLIEFRNWQLSRLGMWATVTWKRKWITSTHWVVESRYRATILFILG